MEPPTAVPNTHPAFIKLPSRLLQKILLECGNDVLFHLSQTCRTLNTIALTHFFDRNGVRCWSQDSLNVTYDFPDIVKAARFALFAPHTFTKVTAYFHSDPATCVGKFKELTQLLSRLHHIREVHLRFLGVDAVIVEDRPTPNRHQPQNGAVLDRKVWLAALRELLRCISGKGCTHLSVLSTPFDCGRWCLDHAECPKPHPKLYQPHVLGRKEGVLVSSSSAIIQNANERFLQKTFTSISRRITSKFHNTRKITMDAQGMPLDGANIPTKQSPPRDADNFDSDGNLELIRFQVEAKILLEDPLLDWTLSSLAAAAGTLSMLSFVFITMADATWYKILNTVTLPCLCDFAVVVNPSVHTILLQFLARHPSIQILRLECACLSHSVTILPRLAAPILPNLTTLVGHPCYTGWVLTSIVSDPNSMPQLSSVTIMSEHISSLESIPYNVFDVALESIMEIQREISLNLSFASDFHLHAWMQRHIDTDIIQRHLNTHIAQPKMSFSRVARKLGVSLPLAWPPTTQTPVSLVHIKNLVLSLRLSYHFSFKEPALRLFPVWLNLFPSLVSLRITDSWVIEDRLALERSLVKECPRLKKLFYSSCERDPGIDLDALRLGSAEGGDLVALNQSDPIAASAV